MQFFAYVLLFAAVAYAADDNKMMVGSSYGGGTPASAPSYGSAPAAAPSYGGSSSSYGGASSIPAPPCPKNYLFSCQPSMQPAPCAQSASSYGSAGAYSANYPIYAMPQYGVNRFQAY